jgi:hypothetical protein
MDSPTFERRLRIPVLIIVYAVALSAAALTLWVSGAVVLSGLCRIFNVACAY